MTIAASDEDVEAGGFRKIVAWADFRQFRRVLMKEIL
jgi:hypothetical protein